MIKKDDVTYRAFEGDCHPVNVFVGENKVAGYVSETAEGQELELSNTYNDSYEELKVFGKSEQKAKWYQSERAIKAGSYQVSTERGIYEVTISDDLIETDDANKDRICFDSISGIGYRENMRSVVKTRTPLTFTKVESSTLPVLPWTAYGKNLIPFEPFEIPEGLAGSRNYPAPPLIVGETYYPSGKLSDGTTLNSDNCAFILLKNGVQLWNKSPRSITITEELAETDTVSVYINKREGGKTVTEFQFEVGSTKTDYEPFNPTPPESLTPTPDYPQQIYDLSDVTVTSRGKTLEEMETPYDIYRCTSATIPLTLRSCGDDKDCLQNDGQAVNLYAYIKEIVIDGTANNFVCNVVGSASSQACSFFVKYNGTNYDRLKAGSTISNTHGFTAVPKSDSGNYLPYITIPWSVLGLTDVPTTAEANEAAKAYCAEQNALGTPLIMRYVLYTPVETEITAAWAQDLLAIKTAPYYTKLFADKETGGISATYKHF